MLSFVFDSTFSLCHLLFNYKIINISQAGFRNCQLYLAFKTLSKQCYRPGLNVAFYMHRIKYYRKIHYLTREFRVKLHAKTDIARIAKR